MPANVSIQYFIEPQFGENAYVVRSREGGSCWIVDPGLPPSARDILAHIRQHRLTPDAVVLTHAHLDHIAGLPEIFEAYPDLPVYLSDAEADFPSDPGENLSGNYGVPISIEVPLRKSLEEGDTLTLDGSTWDILDTSGHSPGSRTLYCAESDIAIVGDALFADSCGRYDFHHSDGRTLFRNIVEKLLTLPDATTLYSGHGPRATIARIKKHNPVAIELLSSGTFS
jgi:glyoxylase-like metal-dependent hydrolase (beta-lactamase superfamily II)